jgi:hypothetical protein
MISRGRLSGLMITGRNDAPVSIYKKHIETFSVIGKQRRYSEAFEKPSFLKKHSGSKHFSGNFLAKDYFKFGSNRYLVRS